jgi:putative heme-binding domain-containing protein
MGMTAAARAAGIPSAADAPKPSPPEQSVKLFKIEPGFEIELVAAEPHLADPVAMDFDARGRIFVAEIHGYNLEGYYDILELNKSGVLDTAVRRVDASPESQRRAAEGQYGTVKLLEDTDGDGRVDRSWVWADHLPPCYGVVAARGGVIALCPPEVLFLADRDGDGKAEVRESLGHTGGGPMWNRPSSPRHNLDNWIYYDGGYRLRSDGSAHEPSTGNGQFGQTVSDWGDRFYIVQVQPVRYVVPLAHRYLARNPYHAAKADVVSLLGYNDVYPISRPHPWRQKRGEDPAWLKFYGAAEATPNGYVTSACGNLLYRGGAFPEAYRGSYFFCENAQNFIHRCVIERDGASYRALRARDDKVEFLASTEIWFRPVNLAIGPDGAMYVVDMYREIIEDYSAIPRFLQQQYVESFIAGHDRGRIWRVRAAGSPRWRRFDLTKAPTAELVGHLGHTNAWWRETAQRLLVERTDTAAVPKLEETVRSGPTPQARLHALCTLDGLSAVRPEVVEHALGDAHFAVRTHAVRLAEPWLDRSPGVRHKAVALVDDPDAKVRLQLALSLGESHDPQCLEALAELALRHGDEPWMADAVASSVPDSADRLSARLLASPAAGEKARPLVPALASVVGARHRDEEVARLLASVVGEEREERVPLLVSTLDGLLEGLQRGKPNPLTSPQGHAALRKLLVSNSDELRGRAVRIAGLLKLSKGEELRAALSAARKTALDEGRSVEERCAAIRLLAAAPLDELADVASELLDARQALDVQLAAVEALSVTDAPEVSEALLAGFGRYTPKLQTAALEAVLARANRLPGLLDALESGHVRPSALSAAHRLRLTENRDPTIRDRARKLLAGSTRSSRDEVLARYRKALSGTSDVARGRAVFDRECAKCHKLENRGFEVGPDLGSVKTRADETLVADVLDPSREITVGYQNYTVLTEDGRIFTGVLAAETATSITLRKDEGVEQTILRRDVDEMEASSLSMMPEELEKQVQPQEVADLIAYLREALGPLPPAQLVLFDDEPEFAELLREGKGTATLETADRQAGTASLKITPPQRFSASISGWDYRIAENPAPGEYRYLRFAWKSRGAGGVMLELAGDGQWPPAGEPRWRYYAGENTTGWAAVELAPEAPREWTVVTRDLWQDFGSFTLTGIAPTAMGGEALFDRIELLRTVDGGSDGVME